MRGGEYLRGACEGAGLVVLAGHTPKWSTGFRRHWRTAFALREADWSLAKYEWELLATQLAPAKVKRTFASESETDGHARIERTIALDPGGRACGSDA